jgi:predicted amino acid racemase
MSEKKIMALKCFGDLMPNDKALKDILMAFQWQLEDISMSIEILSLGITVNCRSITMP